MISTYQTIATPAEGFYKEKGSKFLAFAYPVVDEVAIKNYQEELRKTYHDARHHCYAYVLGADRSVHRANDDGEPNHSAGDPILGQLHAHHLTDVLVVVVRYFGGTKLGVSGLINAYRTAAQEVLDQAKIVSVAIKESIKITYPYTSTNEIMRLVTTYELDVKDQAFETECSLTAAVKIDRKEALLESLQLLKDTGHAIRWE